MNTQPLLQQLNILLSTETQLITILPRIAESVEHRPLRRALRACFGETRRQRDYLRTAGAAEGFRIKDSVCTPAWSLLRDLGEVVKTPFFSATHDLLLVNKLRLIKGHQVTSYATAALYARQFAYDNLSQQLVLFQGRAEDTATYLTNVAQGELTNHFAEVRWAV